MQRKFKILYLDTPLDPPGGGQMSLLLLLKNLDRSRFEPRVFVSNECSYLGTLRQNGITSAVAEPEELFRKIKEFAPEIIHCNSSTTYYAFRGALAAKILKIPFIWHVRVLKPVFFKDNAIYALAGRVVAISEAVKNKFKRSDKTIVVHNGTDTELFSPNTDGTRIRTELGIPENARLIGAIGRLDPWKGHRYFVAAAGKMLERTGKDLYFYIAGPGTDEQKMKLEKQIRDLALENRFMLLGFRKDPETLLASTDIVVHPTSEGEPFGRTIIEAMASAKPVVVASGGGQDDIIINEKNGLSVKPADPEAIADACLRILDNQGLAEKLAAEARKDAEKRFSAEKTAEKVEKIYGPFLRENCPVCSNTSFVAEKGASLPYEILRCRHCSVSFVNPLPDINAGAHYDQDYYKEWEAEQLSTRHALWKKRLNELKGTINPGRLLDIGAGTGHFLQLARNEGFDVSGTEISSAACDVAKNHHGIDIFCGRLQDANYGSGEFDVVTLWHVLEHLHDPMPTISEISRILKKGGTFVVAVPNLNSYVYNAAYRIIKGRAPHLFDPKDRELHLFYYCEKSLRFALEKSGFKVIKAVPDYGQVSAGKVFLDALAGVFYALFRVNITSAIKIYATKT
ncbi:MAG: glycosyltransferase [Endomicrobiales bacterium]|nr:glycosyltransferase [Endomicrobiales bacterium]